ncbi:hypothetical protein [Methanococcus maripaludis]|uniref:hypothetical protein n=1 Tax=Methanococcus maripaludis TaxID=39152 RepID=UPI00064FF416|nr:hypothetical protein [Methanococcus maripaludis]
MENTKNTYPIIPELCSLTTDNKMLSGFNYSTLLYNIKNMANNPDYDFTVNYKVNKKVEKEFKKLKNEGKIKNLFSNVYICKDSKNLEFYMFQKSIITFVGKICFDEKTKKINVTSNRAWSKIMFPIWNLDSPRKVLNDLLFFILLQNGYLTLHASAVAGPNNDDVTIIMGKPNTGKSISTFSLVSEKDYSLIGDDIIVVDINTKKVYSCPYAFTYYHNEYLIGEFYKKGLISRLEFFKLRWNEFLKKFPIIYLYSSFKMDYQNIFEKLPYKPVGTLKNIMILEKTLDTKAVEKLDTEEKNKTTGIIKFLNNVEFFWWKSDILKSLEYLNESQIFPKIEKMETEAVQNMLSNTEVYKIDNTNSVAFYGIIDEINKKS